MLPTDGTRRNVEASPTLVQDYRRHGVLFQARLNSHAGRLAPRTRARNRGDVTDGSVVAPALISLMRRPAKTNDRIARAPSMTRTRPFMRPKRRLHSETLLITSRQVSLVSSLSYPNQQSLPRIRTKGLR